MVFDPDLDLAPGAEPVFVEALAAAAGCKPDEVPAVWADVEETTDLHRVEEFLDHFTPPEPPAAA